MDCSLSKQPEWSGRSRAVTGIGTYAAVGLFELTKEYEDGVRGRSVATDDASEPG